MIRAWILANPMLPSEYRPLGGSETSFSGLPEHFWFHSFSSSQGSNHDLGGLGVLKSGLQGPDGVLICSRGPLRVQRRAYDLLNSSGSRDMGPSEPLVHSSAGVSIWYDNRLDPMTRVLKSGLQGPDGVRICSRGPLRVQRRAYDLLNRSGSRDMGPSEPLVHSSAGVSIWYDNRLDPMTRAWILANPMLPSEYRPHKG